MSFTKIDNRKGTPVYDKFIINLSADISEGQKFISYEIDNETSNVYLDNPEVKLTRASLFDMLSKDIDVQRTVNQIIRHFSLDIERYNRLLSLLIRASTTGVQHYGDVREKIFEISTDMMFANPGDQQAILDLINGTDAPLLKRISDVSDISGAADDAEIYKKNVEQPKKISALGLDVSDFDAVAKDQRQHVKDIRAAQQAEAVRKAESDQKKAEHDARRASRATELAEQSAVLERLNVDFDYNRRLLEGEPEPEPKRSTEYKLEEAKRRCGIIIQALSENGIKVDDFRKIEQSITKLQAVSGVDDKSRRNAIDDLAKSILRTMVSAIIVINTITPDDMSKIKDAPILPLNLLAEQYKRQSTELFDEITTLMPVKRAEIVKMNRERDDLKQQIIGSHGFRSLRRWIFYQKKYRIKITLFSIIHFFVWDSEFGESLFNKSPQVKEIKDNAPPPLYVGHSGFKPNGGYHDSAKKIDDLLYFMKNILIRANNEVPLTDEQIKIFENFAASVLGDDDGPYSEDQLNRFDVFRSYIQTTSDNVDKNEYNQDKKEMAQKKTNDENQAALREFNENFFRENPPPSKQIHKGGRRRTKKHVKKHHARTHKKKHNKKTHKRRANKKRRKTLKKRR